ncbi:ribonuclease inhibitor [Arctopsyche grandis]|uniref:ribonuclease inhibitor n=1 Tax=Arctopsyche grandis TaxID=121162 RepID=UPI00406D758E
MNPFISEIELMYFQAEKEEKETDHLALNGILKELVNLKDIRLHGNQEFALNLLDWELLLSGLDTSSNLSKFSIINCELNLLQFKNLKQFVLHKNSVEELNISHCNLTEEIILQFENILRQHTNLKVLRLSDDQINDRGIQALCFCLSEKFSAPLKVLDISMNMLSYKGACYLASALVRCKEKPKELNVSCCGFIDSSAAVFSECLEYNSSLRSINISSNDFSIAETTLLTAIKANKNLVKIDMQFSGISDVVSAEITKILVRNSSRSKSETNSLSETFNLDEPEYLVWEYNPHNPDHIPGLYSDEFV